MAHCTRLSSENDFLQLIHKHFPNSHERMLIGRGDDCAQLRGQDSIVMTTDIFLENVHFRRSYFSPADIGHKALAVNISDIAGMGCRPTGFSLGLIVPDEHSGSFMKATEWDEFFQAMSALAAEHNLPLTGGDLSLGPCLGITISIWGEPGESGRVLTRQCCSPGDVLFVCGDLGLPRAGLLALEELGPEARKLYPGAVNAHLRPLPRIADGLQLAEIPAVHGAMDISDGLARDLPRFIGPACGADLNISAGEIPKDVRTYTQDNGLNPLHFTLLGGEDYALLGAASPDALDALKTHLPHHTVIGTVTATTALSLNGEPLDLTGFDHFATHE